MPFQKSRIRRLDRELVALRERILSLEIEALTSHDERVIIMIERLTCAAKAKEAELISCYTSFGARCE